SAVFWFDLLLLLLILGLMLVGFQTGIVRQALNLFGLFLGLLVASAYQARVSRAVTGIVGASGQLLRESLIFLLILATIWALVYLGVRYGFREARLPVAQTADRLLGMLLGTINGLFWCLVLILVVGFMTSVPWPNYDGLRQGLQNGLAASALRPTILQALPAVGDALEPLIPGGLPPIFHQNV
ncbi:MAG TPA: CvpA family protein, partial [Ardenticatenaceae bacterium]|nr:CvpA family protein [Ardenticatenaceae bacterium]